jgi:hypothetical protein
MTIAAAYLTPEGVVLGADSTTTMMGPGGVQQLLNNAQKVFEIGPQGKGRIGFCTWGSAMIGDLSHRTIGAMVADRMKDETTIGQAAEMLVEIVQRAPGNKNGLEVGYFLGGINPDRSPCCCEISVVGTESTITKLPPWDAEFRGIPDFFTRCFFGFDRKLPGALADSLKKRLGPSAPDNFSQLFEESLQEALARIYTGWTNQLPLRDAINFVHMFINLTITAFKFRLGPPMCGGKVEIGFITTDRPFRWACHKNFDSAI